ncbi:MAG: alpha/beta hydrolase [Rhodoferax sp.]|nr:alpha/beta hydrolase [Rhodoferax sp.]
MPTDTAPAAPRGTGFFLALGMAWLLAAAAPGHAAETGDTGEVSPPTAFRRIDDLPYGVAPRQRMDVILPARPAHAPVLLMVHGGAWMAGNKDSRGVVDNKAARWVARGFIFVSVNYRMWPEADPAEQALDVARALAAVQAQAPGWGGDPARVVLMGHSAGAHLVALLGAAPSRARAAGAGPWLGTIALDSAAVNVPALMQRPHLRFYDRVFGSDPAYWASASPLQQMSADATPMLLVCARQRPDQPCRQAEEMAVRAKALGRQTDVLPQSLTHAEINAQLGLPGGYTDAVEAFMAGLDPALARRLGR